MSIQQIWEIAGAILVSLGGGGAIVVGLSSWLGKVWANRILENEKSAHSKELESYKSQLEVQLAKLEAAQEKALYISKVQYDKEFCIYCEIWEAMSECIAVSAGFYSIVNKPHDNEEINKKTKLQKYSDYIDAHNKYFMAIKKYAPFFKEEFYEDFLKIDRLCEYMSKLFCKCAFELENSTHPLQEISNEEHQKFCVDYPQKIKNIEESLRANVRKYLLSLQAI